ncbi:hypothetical protein EJP67_33355 [Variovorax guangxiensis]|uniref:Uncharacterized protein n=1 Tax=Variovorax guangxiensis TaxID=1775474 RepID=A0A3S0XK92_9BURK|nr:hypothetical protein [Variovorax guangxiensis]RUR71945.1 hypothetical protein EJP67_33355 [Variovorax guangxiensis]
MKATDVFRRIMRRYPVYRLAVLLSGALVAMKMQAWGGALFILAIAGAITYLKLKKADGKA